MVSVKRWMLTSCPYRTRRQIRVFPDGLSYGKLLKSASAGWGGAAVGEIIRCRQHHDLVARVAEDVSQVRERVDLVRFAGSCRAPDYAEPSRIGPGFSQICG